jgi:hypothetical protein
MISPLSGTADDRSVWLLTRAPEARTAFVTLHVAHDRLLLAWQSAMIGESYVMMGKFSTCSLPMQPLKAIRGVVTLVIKAHLAPLRLPNEYIQLSWDNLEKQRLKKQWGRILIHLHKTQLQNFFNQSLYIVR